MQSVRNMIKKRVPAPITSAMFHLLKSRGNYLSRLLYGKATYNEAGLVTAHNADFMADPRFQAAYAAGKGTGSWLLDDLRWRAYVYSWAVEKAIQLEGDCVECGVYRGGYALTAMTFVDFGSVPKTFYLLDTFSGLVDRYISPEEKARGIHAGGYEDSYEAVQKTFKHLANVRIIKGPVPDTLPEVDADKVSFLSIDMNCKEPEIAAAEFFWDRLVSGAVIVLDDYGWRKHIEQKRAFDEFARQRNVRVLPLPTGQGLIFKP